MAKSTKKSCKGTQTNTAKAAKANTANRTSVITNSADTMVVKSDRYAAKATEKAVNKYQRQRDNSKIWRGYIIASAARVDALKQGLTLDECVNNIINILNRADKGKAPEVANILTACNITVASAKAVAKVVDKTVYAKYINSRGIFDAQRAVGRLVADIMKARKHAEKKRNAAK